MSTLFIGILAYSACYVLTAMVIGQRLPNLKSPYLKSVLMAGHLVPVFFVLAGGAFAIIGLAIYGCVLGFFGKVVGLFQQEQVLKSNRH